MTPSDSVSYSALSSSDFLRAFSRPELSALGKTARDVTFAVGDRLIDEQQTPRGIYLIVDGHVSGRTFAHDDGHEIQSYEGPGALFGVGALLASPSPITIVAEENVRALEFTAQAIRNLDRIHRGFRERLVVALSARRRRAELLASLTRSSLFRQVSPSLVGQLIERSTLTRYRPGQAICRQGDPGETFFHLLNGEVAIVRELEGPARPGEQQVGRQLIGVLAGGESFGEGALLGTAGRRSASVIAKRPTEALLIHRPAFTAMMRTVRSFRRSVVAVAKERKLPAALPDAADLWWIVDRSGCPFGVLPVALAQNMEVAFRERCKVVVLAPNATLPIPIPTVQREKLIVIGFEDATQTVSALLQSDDVQRVICVAPLGFEDRTGDHLDALHPTLIDIAADGAAMLRNPLSKSALVAHVVVGDRQQGSVYRRQDIHLPLADPSTLRVDSEGLVQQAHQDAIARLARALTNRRVGLALGGGAAWGYAHVPLIRGLLDAGVPIDLISGTSMGSLVGAMYASCGTAGLERLVQLAKTLQRIALTAVFSSRLIGRTLRRHLAHRRLEELPFSFFPVAVDIDAGQERVFSSGDIAAAVRASSSVPAVFGPTLLQGRRYVDGAVMNNVPAHPLVDRGADLILASNIIPPPPPRKARTYLPRLLRELSPIGRARDAVRSIYLLYNTTGKQQAFAAAATFAPSLDPYLPTDFHRAEQIIALAEQQVEPIIESAKEQYAALRLRS
jgi:predicted acylesterase/phospholipase RssA/CRP-like cAMP-binding protein